MMPEDSSEKSSGDDMSSAPTILFGKYQLGRLLGRGAFAKVYHAKDIESGQDFAIKCISKQMIVKGGLISQVKREIDIMHRMRHHHIIHLFEVLATKTKIYFVMEYVKGGELFNRVVHKGRFSEDLSRHYFHQLISAVRYCHALGVFHRDLKPENLLLDENGDLKVTDFGLSAVKEQVRKDGLLHTLCGTPCYVAPEILGNKGYEGAKVDIWSCGIILYVLNAGFLPFNSSNLMVMYRKICKGEFRCPKWMSPNLKRFLFRLLDQNPDTRITIDGILGDPWFLTNYTYNKPNSDCVSDHEEEEEEEEEEAAPDVSYLNAFDIISFSSGFDLSGLFSESVNDERFVLNQTPERIAERIEQLGEKEKAMVLRKEAGQLVLLGQNGDTKLEIEIRRLTSRLVVVEVRSCSDLWLKKLSSSLRYQPSLSGVLKD